MSSWSPEQYERFRDERSQPFFDLLDLVAPIPGGRAIDLGCGTGELTRVMHERVGARSTVGLDNSETMLERAAQFAGGGLRFKLGTILRFAPRTQFDLIFSNAALQWVPDHERLLPRLAGALAPGGQLAVQVPANHDHPSHLLAHKVAAEEPFRSAIGGYVRTVPVQEPEWYAAKLSALGFGRQSVRLQVYPHLLESAEGVVEWVKGTLLTDYRARMESEMYDAYLARYRERLLPVLGGGRPYFYAFKRILMWGQLDA